MDPYTGRLRSLSEEDTSIMSLMNKAAALTEDQKKQADKLEGLERVPKALESEAKKELAGRDECYVDIRSNSKLAKWASRRRKNKKKIKRNMAKQSRKINRKKK